MAFMTESSLAADQEADRYSWFSPRAGGCSAILPRCSSLSAS